MEKDYDQLYFEGKKFNFDIHSHSLLIDPSSGIISPFNIGFIRQNSRLTHYTVNHVFFLRKSNYNTIQKSGVHAVWFFENQVVKNWAYVILHHVLDSKRKNITLPYTELIVKILTYTGYEFGEEEPKLCTQRYEK